MFVNKSQFKVILVSNLQTLSDLLHNNKYILPRFYYNRIAIRHSTTDNNKNIIRIWKTRSWFDYWYDNCSSSNYIGALDYTIYNDNIKIEYLSINEKKLSKSDSSQLVYSLIKFTETIAKKEKKNKIILDIHTNLKMYNQYYSNSGFIITNTKSADNPFWLQTEKLLL